MRYKLIAFDLDGTLLDTLDDLTFSVDVALERYRLPARTKEEVRAFIGNGIELLMRRSCAPASFEEGMLQAFKDAYVCHCQDKTRPYAGIIPLLTQLKGTGVGLAVLSNKADFATKKLVKEYFDGYIEVAVGENERAGVRKKPAPDALFSVMVQFGVTREETLYVGDSEVDIQTAKNAGVDCVSVTWGFKDESFLREEGATTLIDEPLQLLDEIK